MSLRSVFLPFVLVLGRIGNEWDERMKRYSGIVVVLACLVTLIMTVVALSASGTARAMQDRLSALRERAAGESDSQRGLPSTLGPAQRLRDLEEAMQKACPASTTYRVYAHASFLVAVANMVGSPDDDDLARCLILLAKANEGGKGIAILNVKPEYLIVPAGHPGPVLWQYHYFLAGPAGIQWLLSVQHTDKEVVHETDQTIKVFIDPKVVRPFTGLWWDEVFYVFNATGALSEQELLDAPWAAGSRTWDW
ncbi:MAG: hypothetical protein IT330_08175 [Anaerolineae bacterium]|nr:hypothetical protein [Anaerolineae bacterium]